MSCSTYTVRSSSAGGKPSTWPLAMARIRVDLPTPLGPHRPYLQGRGEGLQVGGSQGSGVWQTWKWIYALSFVVLLVAPTASAARPSVAPGQTNTHLWPRSRRMVALLSRILAP